MDNGAIVYLLEYDKEGLYYIGEFAFKRNMNNIIRKLPVGEDKVLQVINLDQKKGYIDLSIRGVNAGNIELCKKRYVNSKKVEVIIKKLAVRTNNTMEKIYKKIIWPLYKTHMHALDALQEILGGNQLILDNLKVDQNIKEELMKILKQKLVPQPVKIRADFRLSCYTFEGIDVIKEALLNGEKKGTEKIPIKFTIIGSPLYECRLTTINKEEGFKIMNQALEEVKNTITAKNGSFLLETKPMVIRDDEKSLTEPLSEMKNKENEEEEEEEKETNGERIERINSNLPHFDANELKISKTKKKY